MTMIVLILIVFIILNIHYGISFISPLISLTTVLKYKNIKRYNTYYSNSNSNSNIDNNSNKNNNNNDNNNNNNNDTITWRLYEIYVLLEDDPGKDNVNVHDNLYNSILRELNIKSGGSKKITQSQLPVESIQLIRKSFDPRIKKFGKYIIIVIIIIILKYYYYYYKILLSLLLLRPTTFCIYC